MAIPTSNGDLVLYAFENLYVEASSVPEPASAALIAGGLLALAAWRKVRR